VDKIRVLLANHPMMVPDALRQLIAQQEDMVLVGDCRGPMRILRETGRVKADTVILVQEGLEEPSLCSQLLAVYPDLTILTMTADLAWVSMQQLCPRRRGLATIRHEDIAQVLRVMVRNPCD
jgi:hypothetical protein